MPPASPIRSVRVLSCPSLRWCVCYPSPKAVVLAIDTTTSTPTLQTAEISFPGLEDGDYISSHCWTTGATPSVFTTLCILGRPTALEYPQRSTRRTLSSRPMPGSRNAHQTRVLVQMRWGDKRGRGGGRFPGRWKGKGRGVAGPVSPLHGTMGGEGGAACSPRPATPPPHESKPRSPRSQEIYGGG